MSLKAYPHSKIISMIRHLDNIYKNKKYKFNFLMGCLIGKDIDDSIDKIKKQKNFPRKLSENLKIIEEPFKAKTSFLSTSSEFEDLKKRGRVMVYARLLIYLQKKFPNLLFLFVHFRFKIFEDSDSAIEFFRQVHPKNQKVLCLPRSIFAATTSKKFKRNGSLFIGIFHPSKHMHAWIIEDNHNPCRFDNIWTNYSPVVAIL